MAADIKAKRQERTSILAARYSRGVRTLRRACDLCSPNSNGWIPAHAVGREDRNPSAGINVGDGPFSRPIQRLRRHATNLLVFEFAQSTASSAVSGKTSSRSTRSKPASNCRPIPKTTRRSISTISRGGCLPLRQGEARRHVRNAAVRCQERSLASEAAGGRRRTT